MTQREEFEAWAKPILGDNPTWRESGNYELAWQAWQAAQPTQPAHAHAIDTSPERVEKQAGNVQVPESWPTALRDSTIDVITDGCFQAVGYQGTTVLMRAVARAIERHHGIAAPSTKEGQQ